MLERPDLPDEALVACLSSDFGLSVEEIAFLPIGADRHTVVFRAVVEHGRPFFVKLRGGDFDPTSVTLPKALSDRGVKHLIAPIETNGGQLWADLPGYKVILFPYVDGRDGYEIGLSAGQWRDFGLTLKAIHTATLPPALLAGVRKENFSPRWREAVTGFLIQAENGIYDDPVAAKTAHLLKAKREEVRNLVRRAERLAQSLRAQSQESVLCHSDLHAGNLLIDPDGRFLIVDWDDPILAPKERDLMYVGGGLMGRHLRPDKEERLFYGGYGRAEIDLTALAYYRYERIVEDIAVVCQLLLLTDEGGEDRERTYGSLASNFFPGHVIDIAYRSDRIHDYPSPGGTF